MKILKIVLGLIIGLIAILLIAAIFVDGNFRYEQDIYIDAPVEKVWENVNSMEDINSWSPWVDQDPEMQQSMSGKSGEIGQTHSWESEKEDVGKGSQTITAMNPPHEIHTMMKFYEPYEAEAIAFVILKPEGAGTMATWGFENDMPYPWRVGRLFMDMGEMLAPDYKKGLERLKALSEK